MTCFTCGDENHALNEHRMYSVNHPRISKCIWNTSTAAQAKLRLLTLAMVSVSAICMEEVSVCQVWMSAMSCM